MTLAEIKAFINEFNASQPPGSLKLTLKVVPSPTDQTMPPAPQVAEVQRQIRASLGLPAVPEATPTMPVEGHVCEFPLWAFSK